MKLNYPFAGISRTQVGIVFARSEVAHESQEDHA